MTNQEVFENYKELSPNVIERLIINRGLPPSGDVELDIDELEGLDNLIDIKHDTYRIWKTDRLYHLAINRGFKESIVSFPLETPENKQKLLDLLEAYENGTVAENLLSRGGLQVYHYAQQRYYWKGLQKIPDDDLIFLEGLSNISLKELHNSSYEDLYTAAELLGFSKKFLPSRRPKQNIEKHRRDIIEFIVHYISGDVNKNLLTEKGKIKEKYLRDYLQK